MICLPHYTVKFQEDRDFVSLTNVFPGTWVTFINYLLNEWEKKEGVGEKGKYIYGGKKEERKKAEENKSTYLLTKEE